MLCISWIVDMLNGRHIKLFVGHLFWKLFCIL